MASTPCFLTKFSVPTTRSKTSSTTLVTLARLHFASMAAKPLRRTTLESATAQEQPARTVPSTLKSCETASWKMMALWPP